MRRCAFDGSVNFVHARVVRRHARRNSKEFDPVVIERLQFCSVLVSIVDSITKIMHPF